MAKKVDDRLHRRVETGIGDRKNVNGSKKVTGNAIGHVTLREYSKFSAFVVAYGMLTTNFWKYKFSWLN